MKKFLLLITLASASTYALPSSHYAIIIDAGSSGSRVHLFEYQKNHKMPVINDIFSEKASPGLSSYTDHPQDAGSSLKKLLDDTNKELASRHINPNDVSISVMATAGMRMLPDEKQQEIYHSIIAYIKTNYAFLPDEVKTISGKMEGLYGWLDVNYLSHTFDSKVNETVGSLDMGGASTEIAYQTPDNVDKDDETTLTINGNQYTVFSKSFLGLGEDQALKQIQSNSAVASCYPTGFILANKSIGSFDYSGCKNLYQTYIQPYSIADHLPEMGHQDFIAYSGYYYEFQFLGALDTPDQAAVEKKTLGICTESWDQMKQHHTDIPEKYLSADCANAAYMDELLFDDYQLTNGHLKVLGQIQSKDIDWTLGALLYRLVK